MLCLLSLFLLNCGGRIGYRWGIKDKTRTGLYGGPYIRFSEALASIEKHPRGAAFFEVDAGYNIAKGPDYLQTSLGPMWYAAPMAGGFVGGFMVSFEFFNRFGASASLCSGYGGWGLALACVRYHTNGFASADLSLGINWAHAAAYVHIKRRERIHECVAGRGDDIEALDDCIDLEKNRSSGGGDTALDIIF